MNLKSNLLTKPSSAAGFAMNEMLLAIATVAAVVAAGGVIYSNSSDAVKTDEYASRLLAMAGDIQRTFRPAGSYATISTSTNAILYQMGLVQQPMRWDAGNVLAMDPWGSHVYFWGTAGGFVFVSTSDVHPLTAEQCTRLATRLAQGGAYQVGVGPVWTADGENVTAAAQYYYKNGNTISQANLATGCASASPHVGASFR